MMKKMEDRAGEPASVERCPADSVPVEHGRIDVGGDVPRRGVNR